MHIALTGASGFIGAAIARHAAQAGHRVSALVRTTSQRDHIAPFVDRFIVGAHDEGHLFDELLEGTDAVIHNSFHWQALREADLDAHLDSNLKGSIALLKASGDRQFIYMSSISVHHHMHPKWAGEIDEAHPTRPGGFYGACKAAVEAHLWAVHAESGQPFTSIRPCAVYGIDPNLERSIGWPIIEQLRRNECFSRKGGGKFVHVEDVAAATVACLGNEKASPAVYNLVDCYARWGDWATMAAELLGCDVPIDMTSPEQSVNSFEKASVQEDLGIKMTRGFEGIREHLEHMIQLQASSRGTAPTPPA